MNKLLVSTAFLLSLAGVAQAQGGFGGGPGMRERISWSNGIDKVASGDNMSPFERRRLKAMGIEPTDKRFIFVYIRPLSEDKEPNEFNNTDIVEASRREWGFVKMDFDKENSYQKAWGVKAAPACIGCDLYGNDFVKVSGASIDSLRTILRTTPELVAKYETKLKADFAKANDTVKSDEEKGSKLFVDICLTGKNGYKEVAESQTKLTELTDAVFKKGELAAAVSPDTGVEYYEDLVKIFRTTGPGAKAEIVIAILDHARGNVQPAIQRLAKVAKYDGRLLKAEVEAALKALDEISKAGDAKIEAALAGADKALAKEMVRKIAKDYAGTDAAKHANEAAK